MHELLTPGQFVAAFIVVTLILSIVIARIMSRFTDRDAIQVPGRKPITVQVGDGTVPTELMVIIRGGPDNGEKFSRPFSASTAGFLSELQALTEFRKMRSRVSLILDPLPTVVIDRGMFLEFVNDHVAKPDSSPTAASVAFRRRHPGV
jgi:hypothetical protein